MPTQASEIPFLLEQMKPLTGCVITKVWGEDEFFGFEAKDPRTSKVFVATVMQDAEGNGPGWVYVDPA